MDSGAGEIALTSAIAGPFATAAALALGFPGALPCVLSLFFGLDGADGSAASALPRGLSVSGDQRTRLPEGAEEAAG